MHRLTHRIRRYDWGSDRVIPELLGRAPDGEPQAELWLGAHPDSPSDVSTSRGRQPLDAFVAAAPDQVLGRRVVRRLGPRLPFLLKVLAADRPLSMQVHPSAEQAAEGFGREDARGVPRAAGERSYRDPHHKPEMVLALTPFEALCGFRDVALTAGLLDGLGPGPTARWAQQLRSKEPSAALRDVLADVLRSEATVVDQVVSACSQALSQGTDRIEYATVVSLAREYPGDPGVAASLLLNRVQVQPGEALYLGAGNVHAYLRGTAVEVMASSDNVLRGGLTAKYVDVPELMRVVDFTPCPVPRIDPVVRGRVSTWRPPVPDFQLSVVTGGPEPVTVPGAGARIAFALEGGCVLGSGADEALSLEQGEAALLTATDVPVSVTGSGTCVVAGVRDDVTATC